MGRVKQRYPVELIVTHVAPHEDELRAIAIGRRWGTILLPGFADALIGLVDAGLHSKRRWNGWDYLIHERTACVGVLGGPFDEHEEVFGDSARDNAATKMARYLGVAEFAGLQRMLAYSLGADRDAHDSPFELASLIKACWGAEMELADVVGMDAIIFDAYFRLDSGEATAPIPDGAFQRLMADWVVLRFGSSAPSEFRSVLDAAEAFGVVGDLGMAQILEFALREGKLSTKRPFDLESIWEALVAAKVPSERVRSIVFAFLTAKHHQQTQYMAARAAYAAEAKLVEGCPYKIIVVKTDNSEMKHAVRSADTDVDVLIQVRSSGSINIFDLHQRLPMEYVLARLREEERRAKADPGEPINLDVLRQPGTLKRVPEWFGFYGCHNGTLTAPNTPVTRLSLGRIVDIVREGLSRAFAEQGVEPRARARERRAKERIAKAMLKAS
ncbi:MAG: hypothetical protein IT405_03375 [Candidatus Yanofskybacteria bacterium]|nr:hypothetical protein [Candidatus Yanofskybacteria bacterium]